MTPLAKRMHNRAVTGRRLMGSVGEAVAIQGDDFLDWLIDQTPEGSTIVQAMVAMLVDVRNEDLEAARETQDREDTNAALSATLHRINQAMHEGDPV